MPLSIKGSRPLLAVLIVVPATILGIDAWFTHRIATDRGRDYVLTSTNALAEQAEEALQTADLILDRTLDRIDGMDWPEISGSRAVHDSLAKMIRGLPQVQSVFLVDPDGFNSASSRAFPMERFDN